MNSSTVPPRPEAPASPAAWLVGMVLGTALQLQQTGLDAMVAYAVLLGCATVGLLISVLARRDGGGSFGGSDGAWPRNVLLWLLACALGCALGFGLTGVRAVAFQHTALDPALEQRDLEVTGKVLAMPQRTEDAVRFRFGVESARLDGRAVQLPTQIYLGWYSGFGLREPKPASEAATGVTAEEQADQTEARQQALRLPQPMQAGERWQMTVKLKAPHGNVNPHGFDYELWLWEQGIQATGTVRTGRLVPPPHRQAQSQLDRLLFGVERGRQAMREAIFARVADRQLAGVLAALVVGDQNAIERADWDVFRATGVAHLMSISGLHVTLFAWLASRLIAWAWRRSARWTPRLCLALPAVSAGAWGGLLLALTYAVFSGWGVPAQRTVWMLAVVVALRQSGRQWGWPQVWLLAMATVVLLDPWALLQAGFWLSFVAVGVLFASGAGMPLQDAADQRTDWRLAAASPARLVRASMGSVLAGALTLAREQWVVTVALTPLTLLLFNQVSLVGLLANAFAIPWVTLAVTPLALLGVVWAPCWDLAALFTAWLSTVLAWLANWPWATVNKAAAPLWCGVAGVLGGLLLVTRLPWNWRTLGLPLILPVLLWQPARPLMGEFELLAADVGQGNAVLVRTARHSLLYDAGPRFSRESDAGHRVLVPLLRAMGERLDMLVLSHRDADHVGGAQAVMAMQPQAELLSSLEDGHELLHLREGRRCVAGQRWVWDGVSFEVLHPSAGDYPAATAVPVAVSPPELFPGAQPGLKSSVKPNTLSCVLRISTEGENGVQASALLVGDIETAQEQTLVSQLQGTGGLRSDFLLVPHHGSKTSSSPAFLDAVNPQVAVAQAGYRSRYGHPAPLVLERYEQRGIAVFKSPACGASTWVSAQPGAIRCERLEAARYWQHRGF